jgi:hypothetical protein
VKITLEKSEIDTETQKLSVLVSAVVQISDIEKQRYGTIADKVEKEISQEIARKFVELKSEEIINSIDIESIVKSVKFNVIAQLSSGRSQ